MPGTLQATQDRKERAFYAMLCAYVKQGEASSAWVFPSSSYRLVSREKGRKEEGGGKGFGFGNSVRSLSGRKRGNGKGGRGNRLPFWRGGRNAFQIFWKLESRCRAEGRGGGSNVFGGGSRSDRGGGRRGLALMSGRILRSSGK